MKNAVNNLLEDTAREASYRYRVLTTQHTYFLIKLACAAGMSGLTVLALGEMPQQHLDALATGEWQGGLLATPPGEPLRQMLLAIQPAPVNLPALAAVATITVTMAVRWAAAAIFMTTLLLACAATACINHWSPPGPNFDLSGPATTHLPAIRMTEPAGKPTNLSAGMRPPPAGSEPGEKRPVA